MFNEYKAVIHSATRGKYKRYLIAYGANPYGPRGGTVGNVIDAKILTNWYAGGGSYGAGVPDWMNRVVGELNSMVIKPDPKRVEIKHTYRARDAELIISENCSITV